MPQALVFHHAHVSVTELDNLRQRLPVIIVATLSVPGTEASLGPTDIEVKMFPFGPFDVSNGYEVTILVFAHDYPERRDKVASMKEALSEAVAGCLRSGTLGFVWVFFGQTVFAEFGTRRRPTSQS